MTTEPTSLSTMTPADDLVLAGDVISTLKVNGFIVLGTDGHYAFANPSTGAILTEASAVESLLKNHGLNVPPNVDRIVQLLPTILPMLGVQ